MSEETPATIRQLLLARRDDDRPGLVFDGGAARRPLPQRRLAFRDADDLRYTRS